MSVLLRTFIPTDKSIILELYYQFYRSKGASRIAAFATCACIPWFWIFCTLESPSFLKIREQQNRFYPNVDLDKPKVGDFLRYIFQSIWLFFIIQNKSDSKLGHNMSRKIQSYYSWIRKTHNHFIQSPKGKLITKTMLRMNDRTHNIMVLILLVIAALLLVLIITQPFTPMAQFIFMLLLWCIAMSIRLLPGRGTIISLVVLSWIVSCRYLWWRYHYTLIFPDNVSMVFGILLIIAETYIWLVLMLGFFQSLWPLHRKPAALPDDVSTWPTVDIMIPTYNEDISVLAPGVYAAMGIDWPQEKLNIYILDDGRRPFIREFAREAGVHYITRDTNEHAKAGNINHALKLTQGELVAIFDCDHIATHAFLQLTIGWFLKDKKLAIVQTPHHFYSPDPFERNLGSFISTPNESALFYGVVQDGNDTWDASYFCGSAGVLRRTALESIGGFATESVTEDAHTSLKLQRRGFTSAYIRVPMAAGLATESLSSHIGQRIRWARGMTQIFRLDNPLLGKGLKLPQRLCYFNAMLHFLSGVPRLIFLTIPAAFLVLHANIIYAPAIMVILYAFPHISHAVLANNLIQGKYRHFLWNEIYETVMAWYIAVPTTVALIAPHKGTFNVTAKGGLIYESYADWVTAYPYIILLLMNLCGFATAFWRIAYGPSNEVGAVIITTCWVVYNIAILGGALGVDIEARQIRVSPRVAFSMPASLIRDDGYAFPCTITDYSDRGLGIQTNTESNLNIKDSFSLILKYNTEEYLFPCEVMRKVGNDIGVRLKELTVEQRVQFIRCTFARADTWAMWQSQYKEDKPMQSFREVMIMNFKSYLKIVSYTPKFLRFVLMGFTYIIMFVVSFAPQNIATEKQ